MNALQFGVGDVFATQTIDSSGMSVALPQPLQMANLQDISVDFSAEIKEAYGSKRYALGVGRGKEKISGKVKSATFSAKAMSMYFGTAAIAGAASLVPAFVVAIAASITVSPPSSGTFAGDLGVYKVSTGAEFVRVASAPTAGQYSVNDLTGEYEFSAADVTAGGSVSIAYRWVASTGGLLLSIKNRNMGEDAFFSLDLRTKFQGRELILHLYRVMFNKLSLSFKNDDFSAPDLEFTAMADDLGNVADFQLR